MKATMFPRMLTSHDAGWEWLMQRRPSVAGMWLGWVCPLALLPPAMLLYAIDAHGGPFFGAIGLRQGWAIAVAFYLCELAAVPIMAAVLCRLGEVVGARAEYRDVFAFSAIVPTPLWLAPLSLLVPSLTLVGVALAFAFFASALLIQEGNYRVFRLDDEGKSNLLTATILGAGLVGWLIMLLIAFVGWGLAIS